MALIRGHHDFDEQFAQIPNEWLRDKRLSFEARGLLAELMSHTPGWRLSIKSIAERNAIGRTKVKRMLDELMKYGYLQRSETQQHDEKGYLAGFDYTTRDPGGVVQKPCKVEPYKDIEPPKNTITSKNTITKNKQERAHLIPDDWKPKESLYSEERYSVLDIDDEADSFRNWCLANGKRYKDWDAAFRNWLKKGLDFYSKKHYKEVERDRSKQELDAWLRSMEGKDDS